MATARQPVEILLVDDDPDHVDWTIEALKDGRLNPNVNVAEDGVEAMAFLRQEGQYSNAPRPDLILLDLSMPRKNGLEVLEELKADPSLKRIPVVVLTSSSARSDILASYDRHANTYVTKPNTLDEFTEAIRTIEEFWFATAQLPAS